MGSSVLRFTQTWTGSPFGLFERFPISVLNSTKWREKDPRSCSISHVCTRPQSGSGPMVADIEVTYRPKGFISFHGTTRFDGWIRTVPKRADDGTFVDADGQPLADDKPLVYVPKDTFQEIDFNDVDFGQFVDERDVANIPRTTEDAVMEELKASGQFSGRSDLGVTRVPLMLAYWHLTSCVAC